MGDRRRFTVYWGTEEEGELMKKLEEVAKKGNRNKPTTVLIANKAFGERYLENSQKVRRKQR